MKNLKNIDNEIRSRKLIQVRKTEQNFRKADIKKLASDERTIIRKGRKVDLD